LCHLRSSRTPLDAGRFVDTFCEHYRLPRAAGYDKVRTHRFRASDAEAASVARAGKTSNADLSEALNDAVTAVGDRVRAIPLDQLKPAITELLSRLVGEAVTRKPPQSSEYIQSEIARSLGAGFQGRESRAAIKRWVETNYSRLDPEHLEQLLDRIRDAVRHTPKDLTAARRDPSRAEGALPDFLDDCLALTFAEPIQNE
jgi:hypothetical protein